MYGALWAVLLSQLETYNRSVKARLIEGADSAGSPDLTGQLLTVSNTNGALVLEIPEAIAPLSAVSDILLRLTRLDDRIGVEKSSAKDYNQELTAAVWGSDLL